MRLEVQAGAGGSHASRLAGEEGLTDRALKALYLLGDRLLCDSERIGRRRERSTVERRRKALELRKREAEPDRTDR